MKLLREATFFIYLITAFNTSFADSKKSNDLDFQLIVPKSIWKIPDVQKNTPVLILWKITNNTDHAIILPVGGGNTLLKLTDKSGHAVIGGEGQDGYVPMSFQDYREVPSKYSIYVYAGDFNLYYKGNQLFLGCSTLHGGWILYEALKKDASYKLECIFSTESKPSNYASKVWKKSDIWLGSHSSKIIDISIKK